MNELTDLLLDDGCLDYSNDHRDRHARASQLLHEHPELATASIWCAAATGDAGAVTRFLDDDPELLEKKGGPRDWVPLMYACYSRIVSENPNHSTFDVGRLLLERGADANASFPWDGQYPFTALTGVCGEGESGPLNQPGHAAWRAFAELLLRHGARPDDNQALYNRMFGDDEVLELLLARGLNCEHRPADNCSGGTPAPTILGYQLAMAASRGLEGRVRLLMRHRARMDERAYGKTPWEHAMHNGNLAIASLLEQAGAPISKLSPAMRFAADSLGGEFDSARSALAVNPGLIREAPRDLLERAVSLNRIGVVRFLLESGFDVNAMQRTTALHQAAWHGRLDIARLLVAAGADLTLCDREHDATPGDWAQHAGQAEVAEYLNGIHLDLFEARPTDDRQ